MIKTTKFLTYLALWIAALCMLGFVMTFVNTYLQSTGIFGDTPCTKDWGCGDIDSQHNWGSRHYWYYFMCVMLFLVSIARMIVWCVWYWNPQEFAKYDKPA
jgi:hypothetical protein